MNAFIVFVNNGMDYEDYDDRVHSIFIAPEGWDEDVPNTYSTETGKGIDNKGRDWRVEKIDLDDFCKWLEGKGFRKVSWSCVDINVGHEIYNICE